MFQTLTYYITHVCWTIKKSSFEIGQRSLDSGVSWGGGVGGGVGVFLNKKKGRGVSPLVDFCYGVEVIGCN